MRRPPRLAGERKPSIANMMERIPMMSSCMPVPREAQSRMGWGGGRRTSAWTSFQPLSSCRSSLSCSLYLQWSHGAIAGEHEGHHKGGQGWWA